MKSHEADISETLMNNQHNVGVLHISCFANTAENEGMDAKEIRAANLRKLITEHGSIANLSQLVDTNPSYISQILSDKHPATVGDKLARKIEQSLGKPHGWLDREHSDQRTQEDPAPSSRPAANERTAGNDYAPEVTLQDAIHALETAFKRGSLKPDALKGLVTLLSSINPAPPQDVEEESGETDSHAAKLLANGNPPDSSAP